MVFVKKTLLVEPWQERPMVSVSYRVPEMQNNYSGLCALCVSVVSKSGKVTTSCEHIGQGIVGPRLGVERFPNGREEPRRRLCPGRP
jgi:hypothetical protein